MNNKKIFDNTNNKIELNNYENIEENKKIIIKINKAQEIILKKMFNWWIRFFKFKK